MPASELPGLAPAGEVLVSAEDYDAMRAFYAIRLVQTMDRTAESAARAGLTAEILDSLVADES